MTTIQLKVNLLGHETIIDAEIVGGVISNGDTDNALSLDFANGKAFLRVGGDDNQVTLEGNGDKQEFKVRLGGEMLAEANSSGIAFGKGIVLISPDGTKFNVTVDNDGDLHAAQC